MNRPTPTTTAEPSFPWSMSLDLRAPAFGTPRDQLYRAALDMAAWADERGVSAISLSERHGSDDGYLPAALTMAAAVAARTERCFITINALPLTMHDPVTVAEQLAVLQTISGGRLVVTVVPGYVRSELAMFGVDPGARGRILEERLAVLLRALDGDEFEWQGRTVRVTPTLPARPVVFVGGTTPAAARRAARLGDGFLPTTADPALVETYHRACAQVGRPPGYVRLPPSPLSVHVAHDTEAAWDALRPHAQHELDSYRAWASEEPSSPYADLLDAEAGRAAGLWDVVTPAGAVDVGRRNGAIGVKPLLGGLDPHLGWACMALLVDEVLPALAPLP